MFIYNILNSSIINSLLMINDDDSIIYLTILVMTSSLNFTTDQVLYFTFHFDCTVNKCHN